MTDGHSSPRRWPIQRDDGCACVGQALATAMTESLVGGGIDVGVEHLIDFQEAAKGREALESCALRP